ncbi:hypothetical protein M0813_08818 [Anaeramoeba flamelloides]|uniref:Stealth protein CR2 conserved region 2 domain-containing protein n=1 Tax=Anaeramoeba flamelloides TaxID=1746091 RepID=A0ABQ8X8V2_9EUKA|nr:hypothetical protein M0813_08818 [Anaeramoeba flamelloides]
MSKDTVFEEIVGKGFESLINFTDRDLQFFTKSEVEKIGVKVKKNWISIELKELQIEQKEKEITKKERDLENASTKKESEKIKLELEKDKQMIQKDKKDLEERKKNYEKENKLYQIKKEIVEDKGKIDVVFSWGGIMNDMNQRNRYNYEFQFSLRAVYKYLPWVDTIYILINSNTDPPYWIKKDYPSKIKIIDRCTLIENEDHCPTFNSFAVYSIAHKIPGLSNKFILLDDDFFFNQPITRDYMFTPKGVPKVYQKRKKKMTYYKDDPLYGLIKKKKYPRYKYARYSHIPKPLRRDFILKFDEHYPGYAELVQSHLKRYTRLTEDYSMIYFEFFYKKRWIKRLDQVHAKFHQLPMRHERNITMEFEDNYKTLTTQDIITFNCNDNFSKVTKIYKKQLEVLWKFYNKLYREVPDYELPNPEHEKYTEFFPSDL